MREQYWLDKYKRNGYKVINKNNAYRTEEQNREHKRQYIMEHKELKKEQNKKWRENCGDYQKQYKLDNKEANKKVSKIYYEKKRDEINKNKKELYFMNKFSEDMSKFVNMINTY